MARFTAMHHWSGNNTSATATVISNRSCGRWRERVQLLPVLHKAKGPLTNCVLMGSIKFASFSPAHGKESKLLMAVAGLALPIQFIWVHFHGVHAS